MLVWLPATELLTCPPYFKHSSIIISSLRETRDWSSVRHGQILSLYRGIGGGKPLAQHSRTRWLNMKGHILLVLFLGTRRGIELIIWNYTGFANRPMLKNKQLLSTYSNILNFFAKISWKVHRILWQQIHDFLLLDIFE